MTANIERIATPDEHSDIVGGSSAARVMGCPASVGLIAKLPQVIVEESSEYADEGTQLHEVMAYLVSNDIPLNDVLTDPHVDELFDKYGIKDERMFDAVLPAYRAFNDYCDKLLDEGGPDDELRIMVEAKCEMPGIDGAFGTTDVLIRGPKRTVVWDWKFGSGVPVYASYKKRVLVRPQDRPSEEIGGADTEEEEFGNDQLCFYGRAAVTTYPDYFNGEASAAAWNDWPVDLVICQPRIIEDGAISAFTVTVADLEDFRLDLIDAVEEALGPNPSMVRDDKWCRFAPCKAICPLHLNAPGQMMALGEKLQGLALATSARKEGAPEPVVQVQGHAANLNYAQALSAMLQLADIVEPYIGEARKQAHTFMEAGGQVPGFKLVPKRASWDSWNEEDVKKLDAYLGRHGASLEERRKPWEPISPAKARTLLKGKGVDKKVLNGLEKYVKQGVSSGTTLAPNDDPRPTIEATATAVQGLADKIASLGK